MTTSTTPEGLRELKALAEKATPGPWTSKEGSTSYPECDDADFWNVVLSPGGKEIVTLHERYSLKADDRRDYDFDAAFIAAANPATVLSLLAALEEAREREAEQTKAFDLLVSTVLAARTTNTRDYMEGLADDLNVALAAFGDPDRVAFERGSFSVVRATTKSGEA